MSEDLAPGIHIGNSDLGSGITVVAETGETIVLSMTVQQMRELASKLQSHAARIAKGKPADIIGEAHV